MNHHHHQQPNPKWRSPQVS